MSARETARGGRGIKRDRHAKEAWGATYGAIPKSVWATVAWHLANAASDAIDTEGAAEARLLEEIYALESNGILPSNQAKAARAALAAARGEA